MPNRWSTVRRHTGEPSPGIDPSRVIVIGFLVAALLGVLTGLGWMAWRLMTQ